MGDRFRNALTLGFLALALLLTACNGGVSEPGGRSTRVFPTATETALPTPTPSPEPSPTPTPLVTAPAGGLPEHRIDVALDYDGRRLDVAQRSRLLNATAERWQEILFFVPSAHLPGFTISGARVTTRWETHTVSPTLEGLFYRVPLPVPLEPADPIEVAFDYTVQIPPVAPTDWPPVGNSGAGERLLQIGDWHAVLAPYDEGRGWRTWSYHPVGDPTVYPVATFEVYLTAPNDVVIAAAGAQVSDGPARRYYLAGARNFAFLASREYEVAFSRVDGIPVSSYYLPEHAVAGERLLELAGRALPLYTELYGPYPYPELVIAENAYYGAMEYSGLISMSGYGYETYDGTPYSLLMPLTVHEIAHQWWFGAVGNDQVRAPWLDESFAKYSELLFLERYYPEATGWWWQSHIDYWSPSGALDRSIYAFEGTPAYIHDIYGLGAHFLADLRALLGEEPFFAFVKGYRTANEGRLATRDDLLQAARTHTDADLAPLLDAYFEMP